MSTNLYRQRLESLATPRNKAGAEKFIFTRYQILGVQAPPIRALAKEIIHSPDWRHLLTELSDDSYEELALQALVIATAKMEPKERLSLIKNFIPKIDNWATCDSFVCALKFTKKFPELVWQFIQPYLLSPQEFELRFAIVVCLDYFMTPIYIPQILPLFNQIKHSGYYVKMALAWAVAEAYIKQPSLTLPFLQNNQLDPWTHNKAIQKITESYRVSVEMKNYLRTLKKIVPKSCVARKPALLNT